MLPTADYISNLVQNQFPEFYQEEGPNFIAFLKAYYEWMEEDGNTHNVSRNLFSTRDIDSTADEFLDYFKDKYSYIIPKTIPGSKRFLQKHILDLYRSKGSIDGLKLFFRLLYNEDADLYIPSFDILKPSDGTWIEKKYMEITYTQYNNLFENQLITGSQSGATAYVESYTQSAISGKIIYQLFLSNIEGNFLVGERIAYSGLDYNLAPMILGSPVSISVDTTTPNNDIGDILATSNGSGSGMKVLVSNTRIAGSANGSIEFRIINGGDGYTASPTITVTTGSNSAGSGATFTGVILSNTRSFSYSTSYINNSINRSNTYSFNSNSAVNSTSEFITLANNSLANGDYVKYYTDSGNTAISGLSNNGLYFVVGANSSGIKLAAGNTITYNTAPINITAGATQNGHHIYLVPTTNLAINSVSYGPTLNNASLSTVLQNALTFQNITIGSIVGLTGIATGDGYDGYLNVAITEPKIAGYGLPDNNGGTLGTDAVVYANVVLGTGLVSNLVIKDSGVGYHTKNEEVLLYNTTQANNDQTTTAKITLGAVGTKEGYWSTSQGFIDSNKYIQDSDYYQEYSYEIKFSKSLNKYIDILKELVHPTGNKVFGKTFVFSRNDNEQVGSAVVQSIYRIRGAGLAPVYTVGEDTFTLNVSRLV
jgi:hypothetical protein